MRLLYLSLSISALASNMYNFCYKSLQPCRPHSCSLQHSLARYSHYQVLRVTEVCLGTDGNPQVRKTIFFVSTHGFNVNLFHSLNSFGHFLSSSAIDHKIKFTNYIYYSQMHTNLLIFRNNSQFQSKGHKLNFMSWSTFLKFS